MRFCDSGKDARSILRFCDSAILARRGNKQKVRHFRGISTLCIELNIIRSVLRIEPTIEFSVYSAYQTNRTNEFSNRTWVFIRPTCLTLSLNKKFEATLTHDIHCKKINHGKHLHRPFKKLAQIFAGLQLKVFKPHEFYSIEIFAVQSMSRQSCYVYIYKVLRVLSWWHWAYLFTRTHMQIVFARRFHSIRCLFDFHSSTGKIYKYKGKYLFRRIYHASSGSKLQFFSRYLE